MKKNLSFLSNPITIFLLIILLFGFFLRVYNIQNTLGFYYDQGRDALAVWNLIHKGDFFLIGPTTGIAGIFRAPFYYYLIAPFYILGNGNPIWPSVFLSLTTMTASFIAFYLGRKIHSAPAGIIAGILSSFSFNIVMASRWLSNPTPMLLLSIFLVFFMLIVTGDIRWGPAPRSSKSKIGWYGISVVLGLSIFSFGSAAEIFYLPAVLFFAYLYRKTLNLKTIAVSLLIFFLTFIPLVIFDLKNNFLIWENIKKFFIEDRSFKIVSWNIVWEKINLYKRVFLGLIFHGASPRDMFFLSFVLILIIYYFHRLIKLIGVRLLLFLLISMGFGLMFFQGNKGNFYDYYLTGYYMIFLLLFAIGLGEIWKRSHWGKGLIIFFLYLFFVNNSAFLGRKLNDKVEGAGSIALKSELQAVNWIKSDGLGKDFNIDVYVPPVIPYAYDYLFLWQGVKQKDSSTSVLYTLYEGDPKESERLRAWIERQEKIAKVEKEQRFGGITVQKRIRI